MRKLGKYVFVILFSILLLGFISFYGLQYSISKNLETKNIAVINSWKAFTNKLTERDSLLVLKPLLKADSLKYILNKSSSERLNKSNSLEIVFYEYQLNRFIIKEFQGTDKNILGLDSSSNTLASIYNSVVRDFNLYYSVFPNFFFAKEKNLKSEKYFEIEYGKENEDPIKKSKEFPEWAKNVDTIM